MKKKLWLLIAGYLLGSTGILPSAEAGDNLFTARGQTQRDVA